MLSNNYISPILRDIADKEILTALFSNDYSIMNGQMGCAIFFSLLSRVTQNHWFEDFAGELLDNLCDNLTLYLPVNFGSGLCGIGWGIEFLKYKGFIDDNTDEILSEINNVVMERDIRRITDESLETGFKGILAYVHSRLKSRRNTGYVPFDEDYLSDVSKAASKFNISEESIGMDKIWEECVSTFSQDISQSWKKGISVLSEH